MFTSRFIVRRSQLTCNKISIFSKCFSNNQTVLNGEIDSTNEEIANGKIRSSNIKKFYETLMSQIFAGGGDKSIHRHTISNKKILVRNRLKMIFDADSPILEFAPLAGQEMDYGSIPSAGTVGMIGKIHGLFCFVGGNDATVKGGALYPISVVKGLRGQTISVNNYLPSIIVVDSAGAFLPLQADIFPDRKHGGRSFRNQAVFSSIGIPQISIVAGSCTAGGAYTPTMTEECIIVKDIGLIYLGGPPLVKAATGEIVTDQELGGAEMHSRFSGCTDFFAENEAEAYQMCRDSILTLNLKDYDTVTPPGVSPEPLYNKEELNFIAGQLVISKNDMYKILARILDGSAFKEFKAKFGQHLITGFGYINGQLVGIFSNCGYLSAADGEKGAHFVELCDRRGIPLIFLQNSGECKNDVNSDSGIVLKNRAKVITAVSCASVPKISLNIGGCFEDDNFIMCGSSFKPNFILSWPLARSSLHPPSEGKIMSTIMESGDYTDILFQDESSAFFKASRVEVDAIVLPEETRNVLKLCLEVTKSGRSIKRLADERRIKVPTFRM